MACHRFLQHFKINRFADLLRFYLAPFTQCSQDPANTNGNNFIAGIHPGAGCFELLNL